MALALGLTQAACGNGVLIISVNTGTIVGAPICHGPGGQFQLRNQGGLVVLVVITSNTQIVLAGGGVGACSDLPADGPVRVSGQQTTDRIVASSITVE